PFTTVEFCASTCGSTTSRFPACTARPRTTTPSSETPRWRAPRRVRRTPVNGPASLLAQVLELDVLEDHFHPPVTGGELPGDDPLVGHLREVAVHHRRAVDRHRDVLADALDGVVVELLLLHHLLDHRRVSRLHHAAEQLAVEAPPVTLADVALRAGDGE